MLSVALVTAAALYYLAELVEEYTVLAAKVVKYMLVVGISFLGEFCCIYINSPELKLFQPIIKKLYEQC